MRTFETIATISVALLSGLASGYTLARWLIKHKLERQADLEIEEMRLYYERKYASKQETGANADTQDDYSDEVNSATESAIENLIRNTNSDEKIGERKIGNDVQYHRYFSNGELDTDEEGEHVDMSEEETPTKRIDRTVSSEDYEIVDDETFRNHTLETTLHLTYHYDEELLLDFWGERIDDEHRDLYLGDIEFTRPEAYEDESDLYVLNHIENVAVHVNISVLPIPDAVYDRHEEFIKNKFKERSMNIGDPDE